MKLCNCIFAVLFSLILFTNPTSAFSKEKGDKKTSAVVELVVTATRYKKKEITIPAPVVVITKREIKESTAQNIPDILRTAVGVDVKDITGNGKSYSVDLRGYGETAQANTVVLVDGRRVNTPDLSGVDWTQIPLNRVEKIEIVKGGRGAVLYGDNASAGVINIITKKGGKKTVNAKLAYGSYSRTGVSVNASGGGDSGRYDIAAGYFSSDGYRDNSKINSSDIGLNWKRIVSPKTDISISLGFHQDKVGLPGALKESDFNSGKKRTDTKSPDDFSKVTDYYIMLSPEYKFNNNSLLAVDLLTRKRSSSFFNTGSWGTFDGKTDIGSLSISPKFTSKKMFGSVGSSFIVGADFDNTEEKIENISSSSGTSSYTLKKESSGFYLHETLEITPRFRFSAGARNDSAKYSFKPGTPDNATAKETAYTSGLSYTLNGGTALYASFSRSFRYPLLDEYFNFISNTVDGTLKAQSADNYEAGLKRRFKSHSVKVSLFQTVTNDEIFYDPTTFKNSNMDGKTDRSGAEMEYSYKGGDYNYGINFSRINAKIKSGSFKGSNIPGVASSKGSIKVGKSYNRLRVTLDGTYTGERYFISDFSNSFDKLEAYTVFNLRLSYLLGKLSLTFDAKNILDKKYSEYGVLGGFPTEKAYYPSPERNFLIGVSGSF